MFINTCPKRDFLSCFQPSRRTPLEFPLWPRHPGPKIETYNAMATACLRCPAHGDAMGRGGPRNGGFNHQTLGFKWMALSTSFFSPVLESIQTIFRILLNFSFMCVEGFCFSFGLFDDLPEILIGIFWVLPFYQRFWLSHISGVFLKKDLGGLFGVFGRFLSQKWFLIWGKLVRNHHVLIAKPAFPVEFSSTQTTVLLTIFLFAVNPPFVVYRVVLSVIHGFEPSGEADETRVVQLFYLM